MLKKITLIIFLALALAAFLILRPYIFKKEAPPRMEDRLPEADFLGRAYLLDVAKETSAMLYYHKIPSRDFFAQEFILAQSKMYGLNLQQPVYFFANEGGDWGALIHVSDSSKISQGIERLRKMIDIKDSVMQGGTVYCYPKEDSYLYYDKGFMLLYKGNDFGRVFNRVIYCKNGDIAPAWRSFLRMKHFKDEKLVIYSNWAKLKENGIETALFAHDSDSVSFSLMAYLKNKQPLNVSLKDSGRSLISGDYTAKMLNIHMDISKLRDKPDDPLYQLLVKLGKKISFPTAEFLNAWEGDLSFRQGGIQTVRETYIESELDDDFNVTEVRKEREVKVPGFSILFSVNSNGPAFIQRLITKGILTQEEEKYRFLYSPPLHMKRIKNYYVFHSGHHTPKQEENASNGAIWTEKGTRIEFKLDSMNRKEVFGSIYIPVERIISRNRFF